MRKMKHRELLERLRRMRQEGAGTVDVSDNPRVAFLWWWDTFMRPLVDEIERKLTRNSSKRFQKGLFDENERKG